MSDSVKLRVREWLRRASGGDHALKRMAIASALVWLGFHSAPLQAQTTAPATTPLPFTAADLKPIDDSNFYRQEGYFVWCPSVIRAPDGTYRLFYSRWKQSNGFNAWLTRSEIAEAVGNSPVGPWTFKGLVFGARGPGHWDAYTVHNPKITFFDGKYYLYYCSNDAAGEALSDAVLDDIGQKGFAHPKWMQLRNAQRTGVAISDSVDGPWQRLDKPIVEPAGPIKTLTVNPGVARGDDGKYYMVVKGDKFPDRASVRNQAVAVADAPAGPFTVLPDPVIDYIDTEDMSIWFDTDRKRFFGIFHSSAASDGVKGFLGTVTSADGIHWEKTAPFVLTPKRLKRADGTMFKPNRMERPFVFVDGNTPEVLIAATRTGNDTAIVFDPINHPAAGTAKP